MPDQSYLDECYFVDNHVYNCPFCNRRHVKYGITDHFAFNWAENKWCQVYCVKCHSCYNRSMHLSFIPVKLANIPYNERRFDLASGQQLDDLFFYSVPTSFFVLDNRIPRILRELFTEAEGSLKGNYLTGASACARKIVYELTKLEEASGDNYSDRIKSLQAKHPKIEQTYFDTLLTIQKVTSSKVHENAYDGWKSQHLRVILASLRKVLHELYVVPALRADGRREIENLRKEVLGEDTDS